MTSVVLCENVLELLWSEAALAVISLTITAMLILVHVGDMDPEVWVWNPAWRSGVGQVDVNDESSKETERNRPAPCSETAIGVRGPDDAVVVAIPVCAMLL